MSPSGRAAPVTVSDALQFLGEFGCAANAYGATGQRIEGSLAQISRSLGFAGLFQAGPGTLTLALQEAKDGPQTLAVVAFPPAGVDLDKLADIYALADQLQAGEADIAAGRARLAEIAAEPEQWTGWAAAAAWPAVGLGVAALLSGGWWDTILAAPLSLVAYGITVLSSRHGGRALDWLPVTSAFVAALLGTAVKVAVPEVNIVILTLSAVAILLPGYGISLGVGELVSGRVVSGLTNLANGLVYMVKQVAGGVAGAALVAAVFDVTNGQPATMDQRWFGVFVPLLTLALLVAFQTAPRDIPPALLAVLVAFMLYRWGTDNWNVQVGAFLGAAITMVLAHLWEARTRRPAAIISLPAIVFLVSGSIGFRGLASLSSGDTSLGGAQLLQMFTVAAAITAGVIFATGLFSRKTEP